MAEGSRKWVISLLTITLLPLLSAAPLDIAGDIKKVDVKDDNDGVHSHDENVTRRGKFFGHNRFDMGDINISGSVVGDVVSIGHKVNIDVHGHTHNHHHHEADTVIECKEGIRELFKSIDSNKNGIMDAKELLRVCHQNNIKITKPLAVRILTLPDKTVGFNMAKFCYLLKDCPSTNSTDLIYFLLQLFDKGCPSDEKLTSECMCGDKICASGSVCASGTTCTTDGVKTLSCDQEYLLDGTQMKKLEFILKPLADEDEACKFTINVMDGFHGLVNCLTSVKGSVKMNSRETKTYNGTGPIRIEWLAEGKDRMAGKMYCDVGMVELIQEIKLKGKNGIEATVEDIIEAFGLDLETINIPIEELAANLEDSKERMLALNMNPDRSWTASIGKLSIFTLDYVVETMTGLIEVSEDQLSADADRKRKKRGSGFPETDRMEQELLAPLRNKEKPESVDLVERGAVSSAKDQGKCGSCAAFAATSALETCVYNANGNVMHGDLSEQNLMDCAFGSHGKGCNGGGSFGYFRFLKEKYVGMLADEQDYGYVAEDRNCLPINAKNTGALVTDIYKSRNVTEEDVMALVAEGYQVVTGINVVFDFGLYNSPGIFESDQCCDIAGADGYISRDKLLSCGTKRIPHAITIVGYGTENGIPYWKIKNSWGQDWGNQGFMKIVRGRKHCKILSYISMLKCSAGSPIPVPEPAPYSPPIATCGEHLTEDSGYILSENYPNPYPVPDWPEEKYCEWRIGKQDQDGETITEEDMVIKLTIEDFHLAGNCKYWLKWSDWLQVFNGDDSVISLGTGRPALNGLMCGDMRSVPAYTIYAKGPSATLRFKTKWNKESERKGFKIKYEYAKKPNCQNQEIQIGSVLEEKFFSTPDYPVHYQPSSACDWTVTAPEGFIVALKFEDYEVSKNSVTVAYDGNDKNAIQLIELKENCKPELVLASGNSIHLTFESNSTMTNEDFRVKAYALTKCDHNINFEEQQQATISSIGYPAENYPPNFNCSWTITAKEGEVVKFELDRADWELFRGEVWNEETNEWSRYHDHLKIWDGLDTSGNPDVTIKASADWYRQGLIHFSKSQTLTVLFAPVAFFPCLRMNIQNPAKGFQATVASLASFKNKKIEIKEGESVTITSPHFAGHNIEDFQLSEMRDEADWTMTAPPGYMVRFEITDFEHYGFCRRFFCPGLFLYKGVSPIYLLDRIRDDGSVVLPKVVYSPTNEMHAVFKMFDGRKKGFTATVTAVKGCPADVAVTQDCMCARISCATGSTCVGGSTCTAACEPDETISGSACMCAGARCDIGGICTVGSTCTPAVCPTDVAVKHNCMCAGISCTTGSTCVKGSYCAAVCPADVAVKQDCMCAGIICATGGICVSGKSCTAVCPADVAVKQDCMCAGISCATGSTCYKGSYCTAVCPADVAVKQDCMCAGISCATGSTCYKGSYCAAGCKADETIFSECICGSTFCDVGSVCTDGSKCTSISDTCSGFKSNDWSCCSSSSPCEETGGDCDDDNQCAGSLVCGKDNCRDFYSSAHRLADCCIKP